MQKVFFTRKLTFLVFGTALYCLVVSFDTENDNMVNNFDKRSGKIEQKGKVLEWNFRKDYMDTIKYTGQETGSLQEEYVRFAEIEVCTTLNGKTCKPILNSYVHLNEEYNQKLAAYIRDNYPDNISGSASINLTNVVIDEYGLIQYYDFTSTMAPIIAGRSDAATTTIWPDNAILDAAVKKFVLKNRKVNLPAAYTGTPVFIMTFAKANL